MAYIKQASELRQEAMGLCRPTPAPATFWDWIASIAHINFLPASQDLVDFFAAVKAEIEQRVADGVGAIADERYRAVLRRHHELEQARPAGREVRRATTPRSWPAATPTTRSGRSRS